MNIEKTNLKIEAIKRKKTAKIPKEKKRVARRTYPIIEAFTPGCIGHGTALDTSNPNILIVQDFLVDSTRLSKGGESLNPLIQVGLNASKEVAYFIGPEACKKLFKVTRPAGVSKGYLAISFGRQATNLAPGGTGFYEIFPAAVTFLGLSGTAPAITYSNFFISGGVNNYYYVFITGEFTKDFSFRDVLITCKYPARDLLPKLDFYTLLSYSQPFSIPSGSNINYALFGYDSPNGTDLGPILTLE